MDDLYNPFSVLDKERVIGSFQATGSHDPDVLHARKATLVSIVGFPKQAGTFLIGIGVVAILTIIGAAIGVPLLVAGWWLRQRGVRNLESVEAGFEEYAGTPRG